VFVFFIRIKLPFRADKADHNSLHSGCVRQEKSARGRGCKSLTIHLVAEFSKLSNFGGPTPLAFQSSTGIARPNNNALNIWFLI